MIGKRLENAVPDSWLLPVAKPAPAGHPTACPQPLRQPLPRANGGQGEGPTEERSPRGGSGSGPARRASACRRRSRGGQRREPGARFPVDAANRIGQLSAEIARKGARAGSGRGNVVRTRDAMDESRGRSMDLPGAAGRAVHPQGDPQKRSALVVGGLFGRRRQPHGDRHRELPGGREECGRAVPDAGRLWLRCRRSDSLAHGSRSAASLLSRQTPSE